MHVSYLIIPSPACWQHLRVAAQSAVGYNPLYEMSSNLTSAYELVLRPAAVGVGGDLPAGSEEVWEHAILHDALNAEAATDAVAIANSARGVAHELEAPAAVLEWLIALEDESAKILGDRAADELPGKIRIDEIFAPHVQGLPCFISFASRTDATIVLAPSASALAHLGTGSDLALVMGWPSRESFAAALAPEGPLAHGLLRGLPPENLLWGRMRQAADEKNTLEEDVGEDGVRLRVSWQRSSTKRGSNGSGNILDVSLEAAPKPANSDTWRGTAGEWYADRARAWGSILRPSDGAHPWLVLQPLGEASRAIRLDRAADSKEVTSTHAPLSAAEAAAESVASKGLQLWFPAAVYHRAQSASMHGAVMIDDHRRLLGTFYREICASDTSSFTSTNPGGCSSWYEDGASPWCGSQFSSSCNFCESNGAEGGKRLRLIFYAFVANPFTEKKKWRKLSFNDVFVILCKY
jgi:hypothetical protein